MSILKKDKMLTHFHILCNKPSYVPGTIMSFKCSLNPRISIFGKPKSVVDSFNSTFVIKCGKFESESLILNRYKRLKKVV